MNIALNNGWKFAQEFLTKHVQVDFDDSTLESVRLPHSAVITPYNCFDESIYQRVMTYRRFITVDEVFSDQVVKITFEGAAHVAEVYLDGNKIGVHYGGYTAFTLDLTELITPGKDHLIVVKLNSREDQNLPPFGNVIDYMTYGGLYRGVYLEILPRVHVEDLFLQTERVLEKVKKLRVAGTLYDLAEPIEGTFTLLDHQGKEVAALGKATITTKNFTLEFDVENVELWDTENPHIYQLQVAFPNGAIKMEQFGFREIQLKNNGLYLNGKNTKIRGLNRHQAYPYVGYAMPETPQKLDADILKYELGLNAVRTSHYPQSKHFINRCDELGLLVFTEIPGWQHIGNEEWKEHSLSHVKEMIMQYRNHPSIFIWGVRINESPDDHDFYTRTNELAKKLDPSRPTGGVRYTKNSELLEDIYTYNDFSHTGDNPGLEGKNKITSKMSSPYMVTEYNGHMFPTKSFDDESHRLSHALRHTSVLNDLYRHDDILGGFGWCMFDYNTHKDFGSGDRICYHGIMDAFRNPKLAAAAYSSQQETKPVLEISSSMDVGEYPGSIRGEIYAFTNGDEVRLYKNDTFIQSFTRNDNNPYPHVPMGPIVIDDFLGDLLDAETQFSAGKRKTLKKTLLIIAKFGPNNLPLKGMLLGLKLMGLYRMTVEEIGTYYTRYIGNWGQEATTYRFEALKAGKVIKRIEKKTMKAVELEINVDRTLLMERDTYDVATLRIRALSDSGNLLSYLMEPIEMEAEGPIEIIGPSILTLRGGMTGTYIRSTAREGTAKLRLTLAGRKTWEVNFDVQIHKPNLKER